MKKTSANMRGRWLVAIYLRLRGEIHLNHVQRYKINGASICSSVYMYTCCRLNHILKSKQPLKPLYQYFT